MKSLSAGEALPYTYEGEQAQKESAPRISIDAGTVPCIEAVYQKENPRLASSREEKLTMDDVRSGRASLDELTVQLTVRRWPSFAWVRPEAAWEAIPSLERLRRPAPARRETPHPG